MSKLNKERIAAEEEFEDIPVTIGASDLFELKQAAEAWAAYLRKQSRDVRRELGALPVALDDAKRYDDRADMIDQSIHRANGLIYEAAGGTKK